MHVAVLRNVTTIVDNIATDVPECLARLLDLGCAERLMACMSVADDSVREVSSALLSKLSEDSAQFATRLYEAKAGDGGGGDGDGDSAATATATAADGGGSTGGGSTGAGAPTEAPTAPAPSRLNGIKMLLQVRLFVWGERRWALPHCRCL